MVVIAVVALVVIGPERLPKVARTLGHLVGRLQRYVNDVKTDINREMELEELRKLKDEFQRSAQSIEHSIHGGIGKVEAEVAAISESVAAGSDSAPVVAPVDQRLGKDGSAPAALADE